MDKTKKKIGRPCEYTAEIGDTICALLIQGYSLKEITTTRQDLPSQSSIYNWLLRGEEQKAGEFRLFLEKYTRARELQMDNMIDECIEIADNGTNDYVEREKRRGVVVLGDHEHIQRSKLRVDARLAVAERLYPKKYSPRHLIDHTSGGKPLPAAEIHFANGKPTDSKD